MSTEVKIHMNEYGDRPEVRINERERAGLEANLAFAFIEKWGMVAANDGGEDSAGRQKLRLSDPDEVVKRAFEMAALAMSVARDAGLLVTLPTFAEIDAVAAQHKAEKEAKKVAKVPA